MSEGIFVSYRRSDSVSATHRLCDHLRTNGFEDEGDLFLDIDDIPPGSDFRQVITRTLQRCDVVLVVIGRTWLTATDEFGERRLDSASDTHRLEVAEALRSDAVVVPVRVEGAGHPHVDDLPDDLADLAFLNSWELSSRKFADDVAALSVHLRDFLDVAVERRAAEARAERQRLEEERRAQLTEAERQAELTRVEQLTRQREQQETEARLRKEEAEAGYYEALQDKEEERRGPLRYVAGFFVYVIPAFFILVGVAIVIDWSTGERPEGLESAGDLAGVVVFVVLVSAISVGIGTGVRALARRRRRRPVA